MSSASTPMSFDPPRRRPVPETFVALDSHGRESTHRVANGTLIVVVKDNCGGCSEIVSNQSQITAPLLIVTASQAASATYQALLAPEFISQIDARYAPVYLLVGGDPLGVLCEGTVFSAEQVQSEIAPHL